MIELDNQTVSTLAAVFAAFAAYKGTAWSVVKLIAKFAKKAVRTDDAYIRASQCALAQQKLFDVLDVKLVEIKDSQDAFLADVKELMRKKTFEEEVQRKHDVIVANAAAFLHDNKGVHDFAIIKAERLMDFVMANYRTMWSSNFQLFKEKVYALAQSVKDEGTVLAGKDYTEFFYNMYHTSSTTKYLNDVKEIFADKVNNKSERFVDVSLLFMTRFLSDMVNAYNAFIRTSHESFEDNN